VPGERQPEQPGIRQQSGDDAGLIESQVGETLVAKWARRRVEQRAGAEALGEPPELGRGDAALPDVDVVDDDPSLAEEAQGGACRSRIIAPEDLDVRHLPGRGPAEWCGHAEQGSAGGGPVA
jgi:hypothetical protein